MLLETVNRVAILPRNQPLLEKALKRPQVQGSLPIVPVRRNQIHWTKWDGNLERPDWVKGEEEYRGVIPLMMNPSQHDVRLDRL